MALGTYAYASFIRRLAIGPFSGRERGEVGRCSSCPCGRDAGTSGAYGASVGNREPGILRIAMGRKIKLDIKEKTVIAYTANGEVAAVLTKNEVGSFHPAKVFIRT